MGRQRGRAGTGSSYVTDLNKISKPNYAINQNGQTNLDFFKIPNGESYPIITLPIGDFEKSKLLCKKKKYIYIYSVKIFWAYVK